MTIFALFRKIALFCVFFREKRAMYLSIEVSNEKIDTVIDTIERSVETQCGKFS